MLARLTTKRRIVQILAAILLTSNFTAFTSNTLFFGQVCLPLIHCNNCSLTWFACPIYTISELIQFHAVPWLALGLIAGFGVVVGRFFCGWICPMGLLQDLLLRLPSPKVRFPSFLRWVKYIFLIISVGAVAYWVGKDALYFFCTYCPVATAEVTLPQMIVDHDWTMNTVRILRFSVLGIVLILVIFNIRNFCKMICPVGALVALANKFSLFRISLDPAKCTHCHKCDKSCPMEVPVENSSLTERSVNRHTECIECLKCQEVCPTGAISNNSRILKT